MLEIQKHRGPDDTGIRTFSLISGSSCKLEYGKTMPIDGNFEGIIGFNRLSILDLSYNGNQPMLSPDGKVFIAFNGEIYNSLQYKKELIDWGYHFKSTTDTEIVLALYLKYGFEKMIYSLNGMFAIVIVDLIKKEVYLARDRFGIKPMYYINNAKIFAFASELKSFKYLPNFKFNLNNLKLDEYLIFRSNLSGTLFKEIEVLEPGKYMIFKNNRLSKQYQYFNINTYTRPIKGTGDIGFYADQLKECLNKSVQSQLMSDVKLGCQLSGGIDSSLVTWLANQNSTKDIFEAVSIIFNEKQYSEEKYIDIVTKQLSIPSRKFILEPEYYFEHIKNVTWHLEIPINHPNTLAIYKLSQNAKKYVTVLLSGEGADEIYGGYRRFYNIKYPYRPKKLLHELKSNINETKHFKYYFNSAYRSVMESSFMNGFIAKSLFSEFSMENALKERTLLYESLTGSPFDKQVKYEILSFLPDLLIRQDKMSMAHSIENRVPFLDNDVVEGSFKIPEKFLIFRSNKRTNNTEKYLLKVLTAMIFDDRFAFRDKMGFGIPVKLFFMNKTFLEYLNDKILPGIKNRGIFNYNKISSWLHSINNLKYYELHSLWIVIVFEIWASIYIDNCYDGWK